MLLLLTLGQLTARGRWVILGAAVNAGLIAAFACSTQLVLSLAFLLLLGTIDMVTATQRTTLTQLLVDDRFRGRTMSLQSISARGVHSLGQLQSGALASVVTAPVALVAGAFVLLGGAAYVALRRPELLGREPARG
jgi:hypothetical protein